MRRAWLLALLATAVLGSACDPYPDAPPTEANAPAPGPGEITFPTIPSTAIDGFINQAECEGGTIVLDAQILGGRFTSYELWAANDHVEAITSSTSTAPCQKAGSINGLVVGQVAGQRTDGINVPLIADAEFSTSLIVAAAGGSCGALTTADIHLCIQARQGAAEAGTARATLALVIDKPAAPVLQSVTSGEDALNVTWDAPGSTGLNQSYEVVATTTDPADPEVVGTQAVVRTSPRVTGTELRFRGLANRAVYTVQVRAFSDADNPSDPSNATTGVPLSVSDFWEAYQEARGREQGGCGTGGSGLVALLALAAVAVLRRRS